VAVNLHQWLSKPVPDRWNKIKSYISEADVRKAYQRAMFSMARLNQNGVTWSPFSLLLQKLVLFSFKSRLNRSTYSVLAARLMLKFNAHAATDITGFGILGHAQNLAQVQKANVTLVIHNLPIIAKMAAAAKQCGTMFGLMQGTSAETSGAC